MNEGASFPTMRSRVRDLGSLTITAASQGPRGVMVPVELEHHGLRHRGSGVRIYVQDCTCVRICTSVTDAAEYRMGMTPEGHREDALRGRR